MKRILYCGKSDKGLIRKNNEDMFVVKPEANFCLVADGIGGAAAGELASRIFAESALKIFKDSKNRSEQEAIKNIQKVFLFANKKIFDHAAMNPLHKGMGCTAEFLTFHTEGFVIGHIGDCRTYRYRGKKLKQLTRDHSLVQDQIDQGLITPDEARNHSLRNLILRAVGIEESPALDLISGKIFTGDMFLLCSDGLTDMVDDDEIVQIISMNIELPDKVDKLVEAAKHSGGKDNITVVLSEVE